MPTRERLATLLRLEGYEPVLATSGDAALAALKRGPFLLTLLGTGLDGTDGLQLLRRLREDSDSTGPIVVVADERHLGRTDEAFALGAENVISRDFGPGELGEAIQTARLRPARVPAEDPAVGDEVPAQLKREVDLWRSPLMREVWRVIVQAARVDVTVLIGGETGTGKDLVARAIHHLSARRHEPLVKVNCAAMPRELLESELFGHERGAFTGAHQLKAGKFELANRGTIFLDEIGDLHSALQAKLLHVLQDGSFSRVGGKATLRADVRVLAATNRNLEREVAAGRFRDDLYYRLNVIQIVVPPLRQRREEVPSLAQYFAQRYAQLFRRSAFQLSAEGLDRLGRYDYPGNVRELENIVRRMIVLDDPDLARTPLLHVAEPPDAAAPVADDLVPAPPGDDETRPSPRKEGLANGHAEPAARRAGLSLKEIAREAARRAEREVIQRALTETGWNRVRAAKILRISYRALLYKIKDSGLDGASAQSR